MVSSKNIEELQLSLKERYMEFKDTLSKSKSDPPEEPYRSNYAARRILEDMKLTISNHIDKYNSGPGKDNSILAAVLYLHGCISMDVDEMSSGEEYLLKAVELLEQQSTNPDNTVTLLSTLCQLGLLYCHYEDKKKAMEYLGRGEILYETYNKQNPDPPTEFQELITGVPAETEKQAETSFEKCYTLTLYYKAQVYQQLGETISAAIYFHTTLERQLGSKDFDKIEWALNSATLSQFLIEKNAFKEARHHLAAASDIINQKQAELDAVILETEAYSAEVERLKHRKGDIARCWCKYCLNLLAVSRDRLMAEDDSEPIVVPDELRGLSFDLLTLSKSCEECVPSDFVLTYSDAREVFLAGQRWIQDAMLYYTLKDHASDYVAIIKDHSQLYLKLSFFDDDDSRKAKMQKRRINLLSDVANVLNPAFYMDLLRQLWYEVAETYMSMVDLKSQDLEGNRCDKVNQLIMQSVQFYGKLINSFHKEKAVQNGERYAEGYERVVLLSKIYTARMLTKFLSNDLRVLLCYNKEAYEHCKEVVDYCNKWSECFSSGDHPLEPFELTIAKDLVEVLKLKIDRILSRLHQN